MSRRAESRTPPHQTSEPLNSLSNCKSKEHTMYDTTEYDALSFEDRDEIDAQNHEAALAILIDGNDR